MFIINGERFVELKEYVGYAIGDNGTVLTNKNKTKTWRPLSQGHGTTSAYLQVSICDKNKRHKLLIHRLVAKYFVNGWFEGTVVGHKDANIYNNHYTNLMWLTQKENIHQSYIDSGIGARRNYCKYIILYNNIIISPVLKGCTEVKNFIITANCNASYSSLMKYKKLQNYVLQTVNY